MSCKIGVKMSLKGVGKNPRLAKAKSKNDKNISGLLNQIEAGKIGIHTFTNASAFTVNDMDVKIISIQFASSEQNHDQFFGQNRCLTIYGLPDIPYYSLPKRANITFLLIISASWFVTR